MNKSEKDEYRCHNGLCISKMFLEDTRPQCLDQSDLSDVFHMPLSIYNQFIFDNEEIACRSGSGEFSCGDGQCVTDYTQCKNKRHLLLINSISKQGDLSYSCWMMMMYLTKIVNEINQTSLNIDTSLRTCGELVQFPTVPVLFGHIRFVYNPKMNVMINGFVIFLYQYFSLKVTLVEKLINSISIGLKKQIVGFWLINLVDGYFRKCSTRLNIDQHRSDSSSLYCCKNSSKCISKNRILDNIPDCYLNDDEEEFEFSCSIDDPLRFKCLGQS